MRISTLEGFVGLVVLSIHPSLFCLDLQDKGYIGASCPLIILHYFLLFCLRACVYSCETTLNSVEMLYHPLAACFRVN